MTEPIWSNGLVELYRADARAIPLPDKSVHCVITSPPYWGLRSYGLGEWVGGNPDCEHSQRAPGTQRQTISNSSGYKENGLQPAGAECNWCGAVWAGEGIGLEPTLSEWVQNIVAVGREVHRVLRDDGTFWLNLGDAYVGSGKGQGGSGLQDSNKGTHGMHVHRGKRVERGAGSGRWGMGDTAVDDLPAKSLMGQPWRVAFALQDDGWILRRDIIWAKPNPMPESVNDRPTTAHECIFLFSKRGLYFYDAEAVREGYAKSTLADKRDNSDGHRRYRGNPSGIDNGGTNLGGGRGSGRNARSVWTIPTQGRPEAHFATFPDELPRRCILAGTSAYGVCAECGAPWERVVEKSDPNGRLGKGYHDHTDDLGRGQRGIFSADGAPTTRTIGWQRTCDCAADRVPATVLDPFVGSGTTCAVAQSLGRRSIGLDLNRDYLFNIARPRIERIALPMELGV